MDALFTRRAVIRIALTLALSCGAGSLAARSASQATPPATTGTTKPATTPPPATTAAPTMPAAPPSLEFITPPGATFSLDSTLPLTVVGRSADLTIERIVATVNDDVTGRAVTPFEDIKSTALKPDIPTTLHLSFAPKIVDAITTGKGSLVVVYAGADKKAHATNPWIFLVATGMPDVTVPGGPREIRRRVPFTSITLTAAGRQACLPYTVSTGALNMKNGLRIRGELFAATADAVRPPSDRSQTIVGVVDADNNEICLEGVVPGDYTQLKGKLWLRPPDVRSKLDADLDLRIRDHWGWRLLAAIVAVIPAAALLFWSGTVRRKLLNQTNRDALVARVADFLTAKPAFANDGQIVMIRQSIIMSSRLDQLGEFDMSASTLAGASQRLDGLIQSGAAPVPLSGGPEAIRIVNVSTDLHVGQKIIFLLVKPDPPPSNVSYEWRIAPGTTAPTGAPSEARVDLTRFQHLVETPGFHTVTVTFSGTTEQRIFNVAAQAPKGVIERFQIAQTATFLLTFALGVTAAFLISQDATSFGTISDYVKLVITAFGVSGTSSVATILTAVRGRS